MGVHDGFFGMVKVPVEGLPIAVIDLTTVPTVGITELTTLNGYEIKRVSAEVDIANIEVTSGVVRSLTIEMSANGSSGWVTLKTVDGLDWKTGVHSLADVVVTGIKAAKSGIDWYFRVRLYNGSGVAAQDTSGNEIVSQIVPATNPTTFNGIADAQEIFEVLDLTANISEGGTLPSDGKIRLNIPDPRQKTVTDYNDAIGSETDLFFADGTKMVVGDISTEVCENVTSLETFMYVTKVSGQAPPQEYPNSSAPSSGGSWYYLKSTPVGVLGENIIIEVDCPPGQEVWFWVGARTSVTFTGLDLDGMFYEGPS